MQKRYVTITALTRYLKKKMDIDPHLQEIYIKGEISNFNLHRNGHMYLTLKDDGARIPAVMFYGDNRHVKFRPENGMHVLVRGQVTVYEQYGQYQLYIKEMEPDGIGALYLAYEQLKEDLQKRGLFDMHHKKSIPTYPTSIGLVTSPTSAAVRDMITTIKRRYPIVQITVIPTIVQGNEAKESIAQAIELANRVQTFDTLIVGRGGGSLEDLWAFNELRVIEAVFASNIPIISAIGHETDTTLTDFVSDLRAPTPTGAAELAVPSIIDVEENLLHMSVRLKQLLQLNIARRKELLQRIEQSPTFQMPKQIIYEKQQFVDTLDDRLQQQIEGKLYRTQHRVQQIETKLSFYHPDRKLKQLHEKVQLLSSRLEDKTVQHIRQSTQQFVHMIDKLTLVNPLHILKRGFALPYDGEDRVVKSIKNVETNDSIRIKLHDGDLYCQVQEIRRSQNNE